MTLTSEDVTTVLGPVEDTLMTGIIATGATQAELAEAWAWINNDEALIGEGRHLPSGRVAILVDLLSPDDEDEEP